MVAAFSHVKQCKPLNAHNLANLNLAIVNTCFTTLNTPVHATIRQPTIEVQGPSKTKIPAKVSEE